MYPSKNDCHTVTLSQKRQKNRFQIHLKSKEPTKYDITKHSAPKMPTLGNATECVKLLLSQTSKDMHEPLVPMFFPILGAHISGAQFHYPDLSWKAPCGIMANLVADTGGNKGQLSTNVQMENKSYPSPLNPS